MASLDAARTEAERRAVIDRVQLVAGDFVSLTEMGDADAVTMHRVVCCYPAYEPLLRAALKRCHRTFAFSYPRDRWFIRWWNATQNLVRRITGKTFVSFIHAPASLHVIIREAGFDLRSAARTSVWAIEIYSREPRDSCMKTSIGDRRK